MTPLPTDTEIYTPAHLAALLGCDKETVEQRIIDGHLPGTKFGRGWIIPRRAFLERLNEIAEEEAADRRAKLTTDRHHATQRGQQAVATPSPLLPSTQAQAPVRGRRRVPPALPALAGQPGNT